MNAPMITELRRFQAHGDTAALLDQTSAISSESDDRHACLLKGVGLWNTGSKEQATDFLVNGLKGYEEGLGESAEYLSDVALALLLLNQPALAEEAARAASERNPSDAVAQGRLAAALLVLGRLDEAGKAYQEAVDLEPGRAEWHSNLGGILLRQQRLDEALEQYDIALKINPELQQAVAARRRALNALERSEEVIAELQDALEKTPDSASARILLARALANDNRLAEGIRTIQDRLRPLAEIEIPDEVPEDQSVIDLVDGWAAQLDLRILAVELLEQYSRYPRVLLALNQALSLKPANPVPLLQTKARALTEMGQFDEAEQMLDEVDVDYPDSTPLQLSRANLYAESGRYHEAEAIQRTLVEAYPGNMGLKCQLGQTLLWTGKLDEAAALFEEAADANPMALAQMVNAKRIPDDPAALERMAKLADNPLVPDPARITMAFALAEVYDKNKDQENAFEYLALANRLSDKTTNYDPAQFSESVDQEIKVFSDALFAKQEPIRLSECTPIFVVGMPRSGTTLTEQILCSHPSIFGAGELSLLPRLTRLMPRVIAERVPYPQCAEILTPHLREEAARFYLHGLEDHDTEHPFVVDKMPHNFIHLGLIALIFPKAKIVHIQRDPRDTALSNFQQNFKARHGGLGYAFNLEKIAHQINDYHRMMNHWREVLPIPMFELTYEEMVADQERITRALLEFVGVDWNDKVRDFHKTERAVRTASVSQVRQPIYQTSKKKWRRYEHHLAPLLENLDPAVTEPFDGKKD